MLSQKLGSQRASLLRQLTGMQLSLYCCSLHCLPMAHATACMRCLFSVANQRHSALQAVETPAAQSQAFSHPPNPMPPHSGHRPAQQRQSQYDYQPERYEQPSQHPSRPRQLNGSVRSQHQGPHHDADHYKVLEHAHAHAQPRNVHDHPSPAESWYPPQSQNWPQAEIHSLRPSQPGRAARQPPPGFPARAPQQTPNPSPQDVDFPPLQQASAAGGDKKQSRGKVETHSGQQQAHQAPQQGGGTPSDNQTYTVADFQQATQQLQQLQQQQPMANGNENQMAQMMHMQMQMQQMMLSIMAQQQHGGTAGPSPAPESSHQPAMAPSWNQPAYPPTHAFPSTFPSVGTNPSPSAYQNNPYQSARQQQCESRPPRRLVKGLSENDVRNFTCPITHDIMWEPVVADDGQTYEKSAIQKWLAASPEGQALSPMTQLRMGPTLFPNKVIADLIRDKEA